MGQLRGAEYRYARPLRIRIPIGRASNQPKELMMRHLKLLIVCMTAAMALAAIGAAAASAAEDIYKISGATLLEGETRALTAQAKSTLVILKVEHEKIATETKCKKLKLSSSEQPKILGGKPGTSEKEKLEFEECSATVGGTPCTGVAVEDALVKNELVTVLAPTGLKGKLGTLFTPTSGTSLMKIKFSSCGAFGSPTAEMVGSATAVTSPEGVFEPTGTWTWNEKEEVTEVETAGGSKKIDTIQSKGLIGGEVEVKAALPWLTRENVGGVPTRTEPECFFTLVTEKCQLKFKNITTRTLAVVKVEAIGTEAAKRYKKTVEGCAFNLGLGECTDEVEMTEKVAGTINDYCMNVRDAGNAETQIMCAALRM